MKKILTIRSIFLLIPFAFGIWLWFNGANQTDSQAQNQQPASTGASVSGQLNQPGQTLDAQAEPTAGTNAPAQQTFTPEQLMALLEGQAKENNPRAMLLLGTLYERGINNTPKRNFGKACEWYGKAAELDVPEAIFNVGICYEIGMGSAPDDKKALENFQKSADKGLPQAELKLASLYLNGDMVGQDATKGIEYLRKAAEKNFPQAQMELGAILYYGNFGQKRDLTQAKDTFLKAAELGEPTAMRNLGAMASAGEGMEANKTKGLMWYLLAQEYSGNNPNIQEVIDGVKAELKEADVAKAEKDAKAWSDDFKAKMAAAQAAAQAAAEAETTAANPSPPTK
jgi:TPR repeat protein